MEYGKSVLKEADFYGGDKKEYWLKQKGNMTHRELLKADIDTAIAQSTNFKAFEIRLTDMGYEIRRDEGYAHYSVKAPSWQRAIRLDRLGREYTPAAIRERLLDNQQYVGYVSFHKPKYAPLIMLEIEFRKARNSVEDMKDGKKNTEDESNSISNQKQILLDYCKKQGYKNTMFFVDDGISGTSFDRSDFQRMQRMAEKGKICRIIVKDLSRFGREQVEAGRLTQIVYPSLGITFISIQENVNSTTGEGMEMLPFYNIFNEWYAAQTSKKIRAVWQSKADNGKRVSPTVPFGYMKDTNDKEKWLIDEPAAEIVRKIYDLCLAGRGPSQIARQLEEEQILIPSAYYESIGRPHAQKAEIGSCKWEQATVTDILENGSIQDVRSTSKALRSATKFTRKSTIRQTNSKLSLICKSRLSARKSG